MKNRVDKVKPGSIAEEVGIEKGDILLSINDNEVKDIIDYKFLMTDEELIISIQKPNEEIWDIEIEKEYDEDLGITFDEAIIDKPRSCHNKCIFCFIDQLPSGMRDTLYFKDDDSRLSFLQGNFLTLTNMKEEEIDRIIKYRISPINVSVHTTNPELRVKMLNNRFAGNIYERLKKLAAAGIIMNTQIVCCPEINDREELLHTVEDLYKLYPQVQSVAVVPLGVTKYRKGLSNLTLFNKETSKEHINLIKVLQEKYIKESGTPFVRLSDEFYVTAGIEVPEDDFYEGYNQLEDGVGVIRYLKNSIEATIDNLTRTGKGTFAFVTGTAAFNTVNSVAEAIMKINPNIKIQVVKVINEYFGDTITVSGLLTGTDIIKNVKEYVDAEYIVLPDNMFKKGYELGPTDKLLMLDDYTVEDISKILNKKILVCDYTGDNLIEILNNHSKEE